MSEEQTKQSLTEELDRLDNMAVLVSMLLNNSFVPEDIQNRARNAKEKIKALVTDSENKMREITIQSRIAALEKIEAELGIE